ncbi:hypothetical protein KOI35_26295 [Actinoplanes bogorensis]|uniref:Uncharacterized protein n=1 Tax=Paractinoplanes bogorensis TaxID=1610840 RepID=A0ABS5YUI0_9ACTN|nr:hypothetical protein [Actinoplanes bogorensis]MBU2667028.1 hypothetical protein [Actinoplanes bogorensis]
MTDIAIPKVAVTMLGLSASGKTSFTMSMFGAMSRGVEHYFLWSEEDGKQLLASWAKLLDTGKFPQPTDMTGFKYYDFVLNRGMGQGDVLQINWLDYRGGAIIDPSRASQDVPVLEKQLLLSDSVYIVLDGETLGKWVASQVDGTENGLAPVMDKLGVGHISQMLMPAVAKRRRELGKPPPSVVVLVTKEDRLAEVVEAPADLAMGLVERHLPELLPIAFSPGVQTLVTSTTLKAVGHGRLERCFVVPFVFTFLEFLRNEITVEEGFLDANDERHAANAEQLAILSRRFGRIVRSGRIRELSAEQRRIVGEAQRRRNKLVTLRQEAERLETELRGARIFDGGQPRRNR